MYKIVVQAEVTQNGRLRLDVPTDLPPGKVTVALSIEPTAKEEGPPYPSLEGRWQRWFPEDFDLDEALAEIRHAWQQEWGTL